MTQEWIRAKIAAKRRKPRKSRSYYEKMRNGLYWVEWLAGEPGFEPGLTESESVGLPLTYSPAGCASSIAARRLGQGAGGEIFN
jgi:hypothetical protein